MARLPAGYGGLLGGVGHDGQPEQIPLHGVDGKADAIHRDGSLLGDVAGELRRRLDPVLDGTAAAGDALDLPHPVHVAGDQVTAEAGGGHQRLLKVDPIAHLGGRKTGAREGFQRHVGGITLVAQGDHSEADAVGGDGVAQLDVAEVQGGCVHGEGHVFALATQLGQGSHRFDNSGKHADHLADDGG